MEEAQEKDMDAIASFKSGKSLIITGKQNHVCSQTLSINRLVSSNRYGYVFYATETDGLTIISSAYIDQQSKYLTKTTEDDDDDDDEENNQQINGKTVIFHRPYIPGQQLPDKISSINPIWIALNADENILAVVLSQIDTQTWLILFYDVIKLIQMSDSTPICPPLRLESDMIGNAIQYFSWNPAIPTVYAYIDGTGSVSTYEIDLNAKQIKSLGKSDAHDDNSSICWSPKGKQLAVVTYEGALELYDTTMKSTKKYPSITDDAAYPPCISVLWLTTNQFLLGYSDNSPDENSYLHRLITFNKDQSPKVQIFYDLFFDSDESSPDINAQYFYLRLNETKILITGLTKSLKINVLGLNELNQDSLDIWTFADQFRATVKNVSSSNPERPVLTGMALGLNSTLQFTEGNKKLPPCPVVYLAHDQGVLQVYYFIHKNLPSICRKPEAIPAAVQASSVIAPTNGFSNFGLSLLPTNANQSKGLTNLNSFNFNLPNQQTPSTISNPSKETANPNMFSFNSAAQQTPPTSSNPTMFSFNSVNQQKTTFDEPAKSINSTTLSNPTPVQQSTINTITINQQQQQPSMPSVDNKKLLQTIQDFQSKLQSVKKPITKSPESTMNIDSSVDDLMKTLQDMTESLQTSIQSIKTMTSEHIESMTKIEDAHHRIRLSQKENLYHFLKDRELDPWTQSRLDAIKTKYDQIKTNLNVLLQITHTTIHDRSIDGDDDENEDFLPDLELSINTSETMKQRIQKRILDLSHKVTETEKDLESICSKLNSDILSSTTFNKTTPMLSSNRTFHSSDAEILAYLRTTRPQVQQIQVPPPTVLNASSSTEQKKSTITELSKPATPLLQSTITTTTSKQTDSPTVESESLKNMFRLVQTSIDLFSGATSSEQLQELSQIIATSPLSSASKSNATNINKTPTIPKSTTLPKTTTINKSLQSQGTIPITNLIQTPAKSVASPVPTISVTPATPANQISSSDAASKLQITKPIVQTPTDLSKTQAAAPSSSGDSAIRSLLGNTALPLAPATSLPNQSVFTSTQNQIPKTPSLGNVSSASATPVVSQAPLSTPVTTTTSATSVVSTPTPVQTPFGALTSPSTTVTTTVQAVSPTTKPIMSTSFNSFGLKPTFGGAAFNLAPTTSTTTAFGTSTAATTSAAPTGSIFGSPSTSTTTSSSPFGTAFGAALTSSSTATTSAPVTSAFGVPATSASSPFGAGFGAPAATTTATSTTPTPGIFGSTTTSAAPTTGIFGSATSSSAPTTSIFGSGTTSTAPTTGIFNASTTSTASPFGSAFGSTPSTATTSAASTAPFGSGFGSGSTTSATSPFGGSFGATTSAPSASPFGSTFGAPSSTTGTTFGGFGAAASLAPTSTTTTTSVFGSSTGLGFGSSSPATSTAPTAFGSGPAFGSNFTGFGTQSSSAAPSSGFSFGGFGSHASDPSKTTGFSSFGSPTSSTQATSPFGGGGASFGAGSAAQPTAFGSGTSSFGAPSAQTTSPSFTSYRK